MAGRGTSGGGVSRVAHSGPLTIGGPSHASASASAGGSGAVVVKGGALVFFPSYTLMTSAVDAWRGSGLFRRLEEVVNMLCT